MAKGRQPGLPAQPQNLLEQPAQGGQVALAE
jgi:hypothetical protein